MLSQTPWLVRPRSNSPLARKLLDRWLSKSNDIQRPPTARCRIAKRRKSATRRMSFVDPEQVTDKFIVPHRLRGFSNEFARLAVTREGSVFGYGDRKSKKHVLGKLKRYF